MRGISCKVNTSYIPQAPRRSLEFFERNRFSVNKEDLGSDSSISPFFLDTFIPWIRETTLEVSDMIFWPVFFKYKSQYPGLNVTSVRRHKLPSFSQNMVTYLFPLLLLLGFLYCHITWQPDRKPSSLNCFALACHWWVAIEQFLHVFGFLYRCSLTRVQTRTSLYHFCFVSAMDLSH